MENRDEEETEAATAPVFEVDGLLKECVMSDTSEDRFEGAFLNRLAIPVSDANLDLEKVTVTIGGALHEMSWAVRNEDGSPGATLSGTPAELNAQLKSGEIHLTCRYIYMYCIHTRLYKFKTRWIHIRSKNHGPIERKCDTLNSIEERKRRLQKV